MKRFFMAAIVALVIGCGPDALKMYANTADSIVDEANRYESELSQICEVAGVRAESSEKALEIEAKCHETWAAYGAFQMAHAKFARAIDEAQLDQSKLPLVLSALNELAEASKRWANAVEALRRELV